VLYLWNFIDGLCVFVCARIQQEIPIFKILAFWYVKIPELPPEFCPRSGHVWFVTEKLNRDNFLPSTAVLPHQHHAIIVT